MASIIRFQPSDISAQNQFISKKLESLKGLRILVVGDIGLDEYIWGDVKRISPEAPVPVVEVHQQDYRVGLAANVAQNLVSLGGDPRLLSLVGQDATREVLENLMREAGLRNLHLVSDSERPTTRKVRVMSGQHHIVRVDFEAKKFLSQKMETECLKQYESVLPEVGGVILQDYGKGLFSESLCQKMIELAHARSVQVAVDPHRTTPLHYYRGADLIKPNRDEAFILSGRPLDDLRNNPDTIFEVLADIRLKTRCQNVVITLGGEGVLVSTHEGAFVVPTRPQQVFDVTGAGDTFIATLCLAWWSGFELVSSAFLANAAAGVVVGKIGSVPCTTPELLQALS